MTKSSLSPPARPSERILSRILLVRGQKVMLDADLADLYGVPTGALLQAVKRNPERFPDDFMFRLETDEWRSLKSQSVISNAGRGGRRYAPYVFTEQGVAMLSSVLHSANAIAVNVAIMRTFVRLREMLASNAELTAKFDQLEKKLASHDQAIVGILEAIRQLVQPPQVTSRPIGFVTPKDSRHKLSGRTTKGT